MIPQELEKLVLCQKAMSKTISLGRSGQLVIPIKPEKTVVIYHFDYFGFIDFTDPEDLDEVRDRSVHQVIFRTEKSVNNFIVRDDLQVSMISGPGGLTVNEANVTGHYSKDCYLIHEEDIVVSISVAPPIVGTASGLGVPPNRLKPESPSSGYGSDPATAIPQTVTELYPLAIGEMIALSRKFGTSSLPTTFPTGNLRYPIVAATALNPTFIATSEGQRSYPILNIDYVEINKNVASEIFSSS